MTEETTEDAATDDATATGQADGAVPERSDETGPGAPRRRLPIWALVVAGAAIGALLGLVAAAIADTGDDDVPTMTLAPVETLVPPDQAENVEAFVDAWRRYRDATFVAEMTFERVLTTGERLSNTRVIVQDPPRRLVRQGDSSLTTDSDGSLLCEPFADEIRCTTQAGIDYDGTVEAEIVQWRKAVEGESPQYALLVPEPGCFELQLVTEIVAPPYGSATRLCFDEDTGALARRQIIRDTATDTEEATRITATVTDADWG
jgi:hypothetical protein